jgi:hypothetical protein
MVDRTRSINQIRGWTANSYRPRTSLVERHEAATETPLRELSAAQIAMLIRQKTELELVLPLALEILAEQPLLDAEYYPGDLLNAVLGIPDTYWQSHQNDWYDAYSLLGSLDRAVEEIAANKARFEAALIRSEELTQGS